MTTRSIVGNAIGTFGPVAFEGKSWQSGEGVGVICSVNPGGATASYSLQVSGDNWQFGKVTNWTNHPDVTSQTGATTANIAYPVTAAQLVLNSITPGGTVTVSFVFTDLAG